MKYKTRVVAGRGRGRRIGFPTINMEIPDGLGATHGIYAGWVYAHDRRYPAAIHYGPVPTFQEVAPTLEAYVLDGQVVHLSTEIEFELMAYIRDIRVFLNAQELAAQIKNDVEDVEKILKMHQ